MHVTKILVVDDDPAHLKTLSLALNHEGFEVSAFLQPLSALDHCKENDVDLAILDVSMPGCDGINLMQRLHRSKKVPIIFLTGRTDELDQILALKLGADDYISKPCSALLLSERVRTVLRRQLPEKPSEPITQIVRGPLLIDDGKHTASWNETPVELTATEFLLLRYLARHPGFVRSRDQLMAAIYNDNIHVEARTIDTHVKRLRRKFRHTDPDFSAIHTIYGVGYKFELAV